MSSRIASPRLSESGAFGLVGLSASAVATIGLAAVIPTVLGTLPFVGATERGFGGSAVLVGALLLAAGLLVRRLAHLEQPILPVERDAVDGEILSRPPILVCGIGLLVLTCIAMVPCVLPAASLFAEGIAATQGAGMWRKAMYSPLVTFTVLLPTMGAMLIPALQVVAGFLLVAGATVTGLLVSARSLRAPRAFLLCLILQSALVLTCLYAATLAHGVGASIEREVRGGRMADLPMTERYEILHVMERYDRVIGAGASGLKWALVAYLLATPLFLSVTRETAARPSLDSPRCNADGGAPNDTRPMVVMTRLVIGIVVVLLAMLLATLTIGPLTILSTSG